MDILSRGKPKYEPRILEYRKQIKSICLVLKYACLGLFVLFLSSVYLTWTLPTDALITHSEMLRISVIVGLLLALLYAEYYFILKPLSLTKVQVFGDYILIRKGDHLTEIHLHEVKEIKSAVNKTIGGWFTIVLKTGEKYRFSIFLERVDYIVDALMKFNTSLMDDEAYKALRTNLVLADHSLARTYEMFTKKKILKTITNLILIPAALMVGYYLVQSRTFEIHYKGAYFLNLIELTILFVIVTDIAFTFIQDRIFNKQMMVYLAQDINHKKRDMTYEAKIYKKSFPVYVATLFLGFLTVYMLHINVLSTTFVGENVDHLPLKPDQKVWIDERFNCSGCHFNLKENDMILTRKGEFAKIVGVPENKIEINIKDKEGRWVSSGEYFTIPKREFAILLNGGKVVSLPFAEVKGKVKLSN